MHPGSKHKDVTMLLLVILFLQFITSSSAVNCNRTIEELLVYIKTKYNNNFRPNATGGPVLVETEAHVFAMGAFDEQKMEFSLDMMFRQRWFDGRLCYRPDPDKGESQRLVLIPPYMDAIWRPDIFFKNSRVTQLHNAPSPNVMLVVSPSGKIILSLRITSILNCQMDFRRFPFDKQHCDFQIGSYANTEDDVIVRWKTGKGVILSENVEVLQFVIVDVTSTDDKGVYNTGTFSEPKTTFVFHRRLMNYIFGYYVPAFLIFILSWISLWIDPRSVPARVSLGIITILAMGSFLNNSSGPKVAYATALDVYVITCYVFVFASLLEYALVHYGLTYCEKLGINENQPLYPLPEMKDQNGNAFNDATVRYNEATGETTFPIEEDKVTDRVSITVNKMRKYRIKYLQFNAYSLENYARIGLPIAFVIFNFGYWIMYGLKTG